MRAPSLLLLLLLVQPALAVADPFAVTATPNRVLLGRDTAVVLRVTVPPGSSPLRAAASSGRLSPQPAGSEPGVATYLWTPPDIRYPLLAVIAFWVDAPEGPPEITPVYIPLVGRATLDVATNVGAGAQVVVQVAGTNFGPVRTNRRGHAQVPVEVPPGVREASVLAIKKKQQTHRTTQLDVPPERPLLALIGPERLPAEGSGWLLVLGEQPVPGRELELKVRGGGVQEQAPGIFRLKPASGVSEVHVEAQRRDGTAAARISAPVVALPPMVARVLPVLPPVAHVKAVPNEVKRPSAPRPPEGLNLSVHLMAGGFLAGGDNRGPLAALGVGYRLPPLGGRLCVEAEAGLRQSSTHPQVEPLGPLDSRMLALPLLVSLRGLALESGRFSLAARAGGGLMFYDHRATSTFFDKPLIQQGRTYMGFLAAQAAWSFGAVSTLVELRGSYAPARASVVEAQLGGVSASLGVRYTR